MKKSILVLVLLALLSVGCGGKKNNPKEVQSSQETETLELGNEVDSISTEIESVIIEIEESSEKLDELLNDL